VCRDIDNYCNAQLLIWGA